MQFLNQRKAYSFSIGVSDQHMDLWSGYNNTTTAYQEAPPAERPEKYESQEKAWGNKGSLPWGQKRKSFIFLILCWSGVKSFAICIGWYSC